MSRCARNSKPPLIASEMTAIAAPMMVRPGSCVHFRPIGQPISHSPAAITYAQATATSSACSLGDSRDHSGGRSQIRDNAPRVHQLFSIDAAAASEAQGCLGGHSVHGGLAELSAK